MHEFSDWILGGVSAALLALLGWIGRKVDRKQENMDARLRDLERDTVSRADIEHLADRITGAIEKSQRDSASLFGAKLANVEAKADAALRHIDELRK